jgi:toxin ParE1/3/4
LKGHGLCVAEGNGLDVLCALISAPRNEPAAGALVERLHVKIVSALQFPFKGAPRPSLGAKARILVEGQYVIIYEPADYGLLVVAIADSRKRPKDWLKSK